MALIVTESQNKHSEILSWYFVALMRTRVAYLDLLRVNMPEEDKKKIININIVLKYMLAEQRKRFQLFDSLKDVPGNFLSFGNNSQVLTILESLLDKIIIKPDDNIHGYVDEALTLMESKEFKDSLTTLSKQFSRDYWFYLIGGIVAIVAACIAAILLGNTLIMLAPILLGGFIGTFLYESAGNLSAAAKHLDTKVIPLFTDNPNECSLDISYDYNQKQIIKGSYVVKEPYVLHPFESIAAVKESFFQKMDGNFSLAEKVQEEFTSLAQTVGAK